MAGTGFDVWHSGVGPAGATRWLQTQAPVTGGSEITIRFAMWDAGNAQFDSTVLVDDFHWIANGGQVAVGTTPAQEGTTLAVEKGEARADEVVRGVREDRAVSLVRDDP
jgi:hypothetical protein